MSTHGTTSASSLISWKAVKLNGNTAMTRKVTGAGERVVDDSLEPKQDDWEGDSARDEAGSGKGGNQALESDCESGEHAPLLGVGPDWFTQANGVLFVWGQQVNTCTHSNDTT
eukprot:1386502-Rhodomonas_salina.2